jgi:hypothetical protein
VLAVKHFSDSALDSFHQLGGDAHFAVAPENGERRHMTRGIVGLIGPGSWEGG